jgi:hypothetical protein
LRCSRLVRGGHCAVRSSNSIVGDMGALHRADERPQREALAPAPEST